jgi:hypothetical protein
MRWLTWSSCGFFTLSAIALAASCGGSSGNSGFGNDDGGSSSSGGSSGGGSGGGSGSSGGGLFGDGGGDGGGCELHCSADLHNVLDCNNNVVTACPATEGCSGTSCVPACQSAADNKSTIGCEYYAVDPDIIAGVEGACFAMFIANTWTSPVTITADWGGTPIAVATAAQVPSGSGTTVTYAPLGSNGLAPGQVAILFLDDYPPGYAAMNTPPFNFACPAGVTAGVTASDGAIHGTGLGKAFHVTTSAPVVAYDIFPYGGGQSAATSATLLVPTSAWDVNYIAVNAYQQDVLVPEAQPFIEIVASQANTTVSLSPKEAVIAGTGVPAIAAGATGMITLANPGDYVQITQNGELTGSPILADKPVGVWGGASCLNIDVNTCCCDSAHQELFPVKTLGNEYALDRYPDRFTGTPETTPWRIVGAVDGTILTYDPATPTGAPTTLNLGQVAVVSTIAPFVVSSQDAQHPFYVSGHMTGANTYNPSEDDGRGDPEFVNMIPPAEFLNSYVFFTDPTYPETHLVVTRVAKNGMFADVNLDCLGNISQWLPIGNSGKYQYAQVALSTGDFQAQGNCNNGRHSITSNNPFGLAVWGWGSAATGAVYTVYVSYAYPGGASVQPINTVVVPPGSQ